MSLKSEFLQYRKEYILKFFNNLNKSQKEAVFHINGPLLILAGAGSGKTTVLVNRIFNMVMFGEAYNSDYVNQDVSQDDIDQIKNFLYNDIEVSEKVKHLLKYKTINYYNILAITFTNKAAKELNDRINNKLNFNIDAFTFHSLCVRILRKNADLIGFNNNFTIYDTDDCKRILRDIYKKLNIDEKIFSYKYIMNKISSFKDNLYSPLDAEKNCSQDYKSQIIVQIYQNYQNVLKESNAMDFDDLIFNSIYLFLKHEDVLKYYQNRYKYIMVDEYQDTNFAQYKLIELLSQTNNNICVVGDDDQSIYKFRGATIENILNFEKTFKNTKTVKLEENYRSTKNIICCANDVIKNNNDRKQKTLFTNNPIGDKITIHTSKNEYDEAEYICDNIELLKSQGCSFSDIAILYRMNHHSNLIEQQFAKRAIPYKIFGGLRFFDRKEIKDLVSYLCVINNNSDNIRLKRIINEPKRGIGDTTLEKVSNIAESLGCSIFEILKDCDSYPELKRSSKQILIFVRLIEKFSKNEEGLSIYDLTNSLLQESGYMDYLNTLGIDGQSRMENIYEFLNTILHFEKDNENPTLNDFLEEISLVTALDNYNQNDDFVTMMTLHSAKGLEFNNVFIIAFEQGIFPSRLSEEENLIDEERRLCYVGITRAKQRLFITNASTRTTFGQTLRNQPSIFISEMKDEYLNFTFNDKKEEIFTSFNNKNSNNNFSKKLGILSSQNTENVYLNYEIGELVLHKIFGEGKILNSEKMANDSLLTIDFNNKGIKKIMANFANLKKI